MFMVVLLIAGGINNLILYRWRKRPARLRRDEEYDGRLRQALQRFGLVETPETIITSETFTMSDTTPTSDTASDETPAFPKLWLRILIGYVIAVITAFCVVALIWNG